MLILTRRIGEKLIMADGEIEVVILGLKGKQVRLGIKAPKNVAVHREEVYEQIQKLKIKQEKKDE